MQFCKACDHLPLIFLEQPCRTYEECRMVSRNTSLPVILDECVTDLSVIVQAHHDQTADIVDLKISKMGGISKMKEAIDFCHKMGLPMIIIDQWGGRIRIWYKSCLCQSH